MKGRNPTFLNVGGTTSTTSLLKLYNMMINFLVVILVVVSLECVTALHADEVGKFDTFIQTTGHGPVQYNSVVTTNKKRNYLITSDSISTPSWLVSSSSSVLHKSSTTSTSCYVACRTVTTGQLLWRRYVCKKQQQVGQQQHHVTYVIGGNDETSRYSSSTRISTSSGSAIITIDTINQFVSCWNVVDGSLKWELPLLSSSISSNVNKASHIYTVYNAFMDNTQQQQQGDDDEKKKKKEVVVIVQHSSSMIQQQQQKKPKGPDYFFIDLQTGKELDPNFLKQQQQSLLFQQPTAPAYTSSVQQLTCSSSSSSSSTTDQQEERIWNVKRISEQEIIVMTHIHTSIPVAGQEQSLVIPLSGSSLSTTTTLFVPSDIMTGYNFLIPCSFQSIGIFVTSQKGFSGAMKIQLATTNGTTTTTNSVLTMEYKWIQEESLAQVWNALLFDDVRTPTTTTTTTSTDHTDDDIPIMEDHYNYFSFTMRLKLQYASIQTTVQQLLTYMNFGTGSSRSTNNRIVVDHPILHHNKFGLTKVAVFLTDSSKIIAIDTNPPSSTSGSTSFVSTNHHQQQPNYQIRYQLDIPTMMSTPGDPKRNDDLVVGVQHRWTKLIHGTTNTGIGTHGIQGSSHSRHVLRVSYYDNTSMEGGDHDTIVSMLSYQCFDGTHGTIYEQGTVPLPTSTKNVIMIKQIIPVVGMVSSQSSNTGNNSGSVCRQDALLLLHDHTILSVLDQRTTKSLVEQYSNHLPLSLLSSLSSPPTLLPSSSSSNKKNGFFTHYVDVESSTVTSLSIRTTVDGTKKVMADVVGTTTFLPLEKIIQVHYPNRDEVIASTCHVRGDDSLLLKYLNPHIMVVVTSIVPPTGGTTITTTTTSDVLMNALQNGSNGVMMSNSGSKSRTTTATTTTTLGGGGSTTTSKRKPMGVTEDSSSAASTGGATTLDASATSTAAASSSSSATPPNLFINIVDTVSGRILYRMSHTDAVPLSGSSSSSSDALLLPSTNVLMSENWIYYTYYNYRTRRTDLGVLSLYEGLIDPKGLTAFTPTPSSSSSSSGGSTSDSTTTTSVSSSSSSLSSTFTSLDPNRSLKPVVIHKVYTLPNVHVTALGMTMTRSGIGTKKIILATHHGQLYTVSRSYLDPRRPLGVVTEMEKKEMIQQYNPLITLVPYSSLSYEYQFSPNIQSILTVPTDLESQTFVLVYGGSRRSIGGNSNSGGGGGGGGGDIYLLRYSPASGFDLLPDTFNRFLLFIVVCTLFILYSIIQRMSSKKMIQLGWV